MDDRILDWVSLAEKFSADGDPLSMRTAAREIFELDENSVEGLAIMAEFALYSGNLDEADYFAQLTLSAEPNHLRGRLIAGGIAVKQLRLKDQLKIFDDLINDAHDELKSLRNDSRTLYQQSTKPAEKISATDEKKRLDKKIFITRSILFKALCWQSNGLYLAAEPARAAAALLEASKLTDKNDQAVELYSKYLFMRNYRDVQSTQTKAIAEKYNEFFAQVETFQHERATFDGERKIRIGYLSPDFREHAIANFLAPFLGNYDAENFSVTCYSTGKKDFVTDRLKNFKVGWRNLVGKEPIEAAKIIAADNLDILVDLSGHSQDSCLPILAYKPAPVQICALGYTSTTGLNAVDYFLSDKVCTLEYLPNNFTEKILRLETSCLCYAPGLIREMPEACSRAPFLENDFVTFGSFNNFAKVTDDLLYLWRAILDGVPDSRLILKGKIFSVDDGKEIIKRRLKMFSFPIERVEFRPYSPDYLEQYRDVDIALDTFPYTGGTTTCEALYMGVPVITQRGKVHGSRLGASILVAADCAELVASGSMDYIKKAIALAQRKDLISAYHAGLREHVKNSALMNGKLFMRNLEKIYRSIVEGEVVQ